jgi:putative FmdB family regulatory protein
MPIYEYQCTSCHHIFEARRSYAEADSPTPCPRCGHTQVKRLVSVFGAKTGSYLRPPEKDAFRGTPPPSS